MFAGQVHRVAGIIMLLLVVTLVVALFTAETPSTDVDDFPADFQSVVDDEVRYLVGQAMQILTGILVALLGAALYVVFRSRERFLALVGFTGFVLMAALFVTSSAAFVEVHALANNLEAEESFAGEAEVLELGRAFTELGDGAFFLGVTFFAIGLIGFGAMIGIAPVRPPVPDPDDGEASLVRQPGWAGSRWRPVSFISPAGCSFSARSSFSWSSLLSFSQSSGIWSLASGSSAVRGLAQRNDLGQLPVQGPQ